MPHQLEQPLSDTKNLLDTLRKLRGDIQKEGQETFERWQPMIKNRPFCISGYNLACYLAMRRRDLRPLQEALMPLGLSSLGRSEARVLANLDAVIASLSHIVHKKTTVPHPRLSAFFRGDRMLERNTERVFGAIQHQRFGRIMVTFPTEASQDYDFVHNLMVQGMDCARINCAHDNPEVWEAMIAHVRRAEAETGRQCKIYMDLGGPKARIVDVIAPSKKRLKEGKTLLLTRKKPKPNKKFPFQGRCALPEVFDQLSIGDAVWINDGKIGTVVEDILKEGLVLRVNHARDIGERLREEKGLNFPNTELELDPLTADDLSALDFIVQHADIVGYSFVQSADDMRHLQAELVARSERGRKIAIVAKIETHRAIRNLPEIILAGAGVQPFGVMIARGDLGVEVGYQRMAEIQEEILWLCEAAHVPVIWATEVLKNFVSDGTPSRSEMTDAAMAVRAECVMLNKGPYVPEAVAILNNVLTRMQEHQQKKTPRLRALRAWEAIP